LDDRGERDITRPAVLSNGFTEAVKRRDFTCFLVGFLAGCVAKPPTTPEDVGELTMNVPVFPG
jgi:hypothetical protein